MSTPAATSGKLSDCLLISIIINALLMFYVYMLQPTMPGLLKILTF